MAVLEIRVFAGRVMNALPCAGSRIRTACAPPRRPQDETRVPSPVRERDRVRGVRRPEKAGRERASKTCSSLTRPVPHPNPLPHGRGGASRSPHQR
ncbi:protein of unassigned function [Methylobacterium oryzae CBMB20]|uniref:Protein of unassigned function n=1 Tax=Methylobacterium oryzae CBMB20 TaxID=693986 RepID=A0A089NTW9_9HYPH|nr:protein of unassigned function [Methylobacterium oryzae CBMB20]